ncbi:cytochrome P450 [Xylariaceae sp. FL0804]|nr:cytochrome P450 [Xylariaceae sp. FL0804]
MTRLATALSEVHHGPTLAVLAVLLALSYAYVFWFRAVGAVTVPSLRDPIPFVFNTVQFIFNKQRFMERANQALKNAPIIKFRLATKPVYLVGRLKDYQTIFASRDLTYDGIMVLIGFPRLYRMTKSEVQRFANDRTGSRETPLPGFAHVPPEDRVWARKYHVLYDFLSRPHHIKPIIDEFTRQFSTAVESCPVGEWTTLSIDKLARGDFTRCAITTLFGPKILELSPDFLDAFWGYDAYASVLVYGLPEWMYPAPYRASDRFLNRIERYIDAGMKNFDWDGPDVEASWEPQFGTRITRELTKWLTDAGFRRKSVAGALGTLVFAQNSNTIPVVTWMLMELNKDPALLRAVREETSSAFITDPTTGSRKLDVQKLAALPLLQSLLTEVLRLRVSMIIMRVVEKDMTISGVNIAKGSLLHAYSQLAHLDEEVWGAPGHPADEFWAERHIKYAGKNREFAMRGSTAGFMPFGGGVPMCPGRQFARNEIFTMVAILLDHFEMEFVKWTKFDGTASDRAAESDRRFVGIGTLPPDRDMTVRWRRIW